MIRFDSSQLLSSARGSSFRFFQTEMETDRFLDLATSKPQLSQKSLGRSKSLTIFSSDPKQIKKVSHNHGGACLSRVPTGLRPPVAPDLSSDGPWGTAGGRGRAGRRCRRGGEREIPISRLDSQTGHKVLNVRLVRPKCRWIPHPFHALQPTGISPRSIL